MHYLILTLFADNRRLSFGRTAPPATPTPAATTAPAAGPDTVTPVRSAGVFSYFMRSPTGTNPTSATGTSSTTTSEVPLSVTKKTPSQGLKSHDLDTIIEHEEPELPKVVLPKRRFIYGDDTSESGSSHASTDLLAAMGEREASPIPGSSGALRSTLKRSTSGSSGTEDIGLDSPIPTVHTPSTQHQSTISPNVHPSNLTDMMNLEDPTSPGGDNVHSIPAWTQGFEITEVGNTELARMFSTDTDSTSPLSQFDSENQPSMKEVNTLSNTFDSTGGRVKELNPAHLPPPPSAAAPIVPVVAAVPSPAPAPAASGLSRWWSSSPAPAPAVPPPVPSTAPVDSPPKGIAKGRTLSADNLYGSTKSTATDDSTEGNYWFTSPPANKVTMANSSTHSAGGLGGNGAVPPPSDTFGRGRMKSVSICF